MIWLGLKRTTLPAVVRTRPRKVKGKGSLFHLVPFHRTAMTATRCPPLAVCYYHPSPIHPPLDWLSVYPPLALQLWFVSTAPGDWARADSLAGIPATSRFCPCSATFISSQTSYSVLRRLASHPKSQFTPIPSAPRAQQVREDTAGRWHRKGTDGCRDSYDMSLLSQARCLSGLSPQSCPEEPALTWVSAQSLPLLRSLALSYWPEVQQFEAGVLPGKATPTLPFSCCPS